MRDTPHLHVGAEGLDEPDVVPLGALRVLCQVDTHHAPGSADGCHCRRKSLRHGLHAIAEVQTERDRISNQNQQ